MIILGITGTLGAGKGTIVEYLVERKGFVHYSVREFLIGVIKSRNLPVNRDTMVSTANELRANNGSSYIANELYKKAVLHKTDCIIESIRTPGEAELLSKKGDFFLLAVDAPPNIRYERIKQRASETDHISFETFIQNETREFTSDDPNRQNLKKCIEMADYLIINDSDLNHLHQQIELIFNQISTLNGKQQ